MTFKTDLSFHRVYLCMSMYGNMHWCVLLLGSRGVHMSPWIIDDKAGDSEQPQVGALLEQHILSTSEP